MTAAALTRLVNGFQAAQAVHAAAVLGIPDLLAAGPRASDDLAAATDTHAPSLYRLLRALAALGVLEEDGERRFALTALGDGLRSDAPEPVGAWAVHVGQPYFWEAWGHLLHSVRTGETAFRALHGEDIWSWRGRQPEAGAVFGAAMTAASRRANRALEGAYDFSRFGTVVDVGGGRGALLAGLLARHPTMRGILFDQPQVVAGAAEVLAAAGVADRCEIVGGDFFSGVPQGGDAYLLKWIVHDWDDEEAVAILRACRAATPGGGALLLVERVVGPPNEEPESKLSDLNMLVMPGGRERTREEYAALLAAAGFALRDVVPTGTGLAVIEGAPA
jgi:hypothetical protein